ncbi:MAG TPA: hypothetical protein VKE74_01905 [Gemmataceae bacterium]|nr:hypothetical protein [Gemmataceae bacterium]
MPEFAAFVGGLVLITSLLPQVMQNVHNTLIGTRKVVRYIREWTGHKPKRSNKKKR